MATDIREFLLSRVSAFKTEANSIDEKLLKDARQILTACQRIGRSWSNSFAGYHGLLYYENFQPPPLNSRFSGEWGGIQGLPDGWNQRTPEEVKEAIETQIGPKFSIDKVEALASELAEHATDFRASLIDRFSDVPTTNRTDRVFSEIRKSSFGGIRDSYIKAQIPNGLATRDMKALLQGTCIPSHIYYEGVGVEIEAVSEGVIEFVKLLDRLVESVQETVLESSRVSESQLETLHPEIYAKCEKLYHDGSYPESVEKGFKVVRDRLRKHTGHETGTKAFGKASANGKSLYIKGAAAPNVERDFNEAVKFLTMSIDYFRNEKSHTSDSKIEDPIRAYEYLRMASLALHLLDGAALVDRWPWETSV